MNSFNHYSLGSCGEWLYDTVAGIEWDDAAPGYKHFTVYPHIGGGLASAAATIHSVYGDIKSRWSQARTSEHVIGASLQFLETSLDVTVPPNTTATVYFPFSDKTQVTDGNKPVSSSPYVKYVRNDGNYVVYDVQSGSYHFFTKTLVATK
jgi:alpha-L-rhamnosidase